MTPSGPHALRNSRLNAKAFWCRMSPVDLRQTLQKNFKGIAAHGSRYGIRYRIEWWYIAADLWDFGHAGDEAAHHSRASPSHDQIVRHVGNDNALRMVRNDTEMVS